MMFQGEFMRALKTVLLLFLLIPFSLLGQERKPIQKFKLPAKVSASDYAGGVVWVKLKEDHKTLFESSSRASGKAFAKIKMQSAHPLVKHKSVRNQAARSAPRKLNIDITRYYQIRFDAKQPIEDYINELYATGYFEVIEPAYTSRAMYTPNDPQSGSQYHLSLIKAFDAWDVSQGNESIVIGIVDSGGDVDHPDLASQLFIDATEPIDGLDNNDDGYVDNNKGWDFSGDDASLINQPGFLGDNNPSIIKGGIHSHGTWVAGCASAATDNGTGISGVGFKTKLLFTKHLADNEPEAATNYSSNTYQGILYAATHGAKIINCSWGGSTASAVYQDIISYVTLDLGCLVVAAAGNGGTTTPVYPAAYEYVLSIGNTNSNDIAAPFTTYGNTIDMTAPGVGVLTTGFNDVYENKSGTSISAPVVSGAAALVWAANPTYTALQVGEQLRVSADPIIYANSDVKYQNKLGSGRLDIKNALTLQSPSIRASKPVIVSDDGNPPDPGQSASLYFDFTNYLKSTSSGLEISISSTSTFLTITKSTINPGIISENTTMRNALDPFMLTLSSATPLNTTMEVLITYRDGTYQDTQTINFVIPSYIDINENNITTTLSSNGRMGYEDTQNSANGSGFVYSDQNILYEMGLIMGTSSTDLFNSVRGINSTFDQDFTTASKIIKKTPGERAYSEVSGTFRNQETEGAETLLVSYRSLVWKNVPYNNFIILEYNVKNKTDAPINDFYFGIFSDWDISSGGGGDRAGWENDVRLGYVFPAQVSNLPQAGIQELSGKPHYFAIDNNQDIPGNPFGTYDGYTDDEKFTSISSGLAKTEAGDVANGNDVSHAVSSGPYTIAAGGEIKIAFALHGAKNYTELVNSAKYADSVYRFSLEATMPLVMATETCVGSAATITASGGTSYKWYRDFTGGQPLHTGSSFTTSPLFGDTIFYVSNVYKSYESVRAAASVTVRANPTITTSRNPILCDGESITLQTESADGYLWNTGETTQSIIVSTGGDYTVKVLDGNLGCHATSPPVTITIIASPTAGFIIGGQLFPGETILFINESTDAVSWAWDFGDGTSSTDKNPTHDYVTEGNYTVTLTAIGANGCLDIIAQNVGIVTGVETSLLNEIKIYPNPVNEDRLLITTPGDFKNEFEVSILNIHGQRIKKSMLAGGEENVISVSDLSEGIYYISIKSGNNKVARKIIVQR
jgi:serine protease